MKTTDSFESNAQLFQQLVAARGLSPQEIGGLFSSTLESTRWLEAVILASEDSDETWQRVHLVWRYEVLGPRVHLERLSQMAAEFPQRAASRSLRIQYVGCQLLAQTLFAAAFSATLGEDAAALWLGDWCVKNISEGAPIVERDALTTGATQAFLLRLYCLWQRIPMDLESLGVNDCGPFQPIFDQWENPIALETATLGLCEFHAQKALNYLKPNNDLVFGLNAGPMKEFPAEILFLQRVRRDLGLSVPNPEHPIIRSPLMKCPFPCPRSGRDPFLEDAYLRCKEMMPYLNIPWEEEIIAAS